MTRAILRRVRRDAFAWLRSPSASRLAGVTLFVLVVVAAGWRAVPAVRWVDNERAQTRGLTRLERELSPARSVDIDPRPLLRAAELIPPHATYAILVDRRYPVSHEVTLLTLPSFAAYWLLPRRRLPDAAEVDWVISYRADLAPYGVASAQTFDLGQDVTLVRTR